MDKIEFKKMLGSIAKNFGFDFLFHVWIKESREVIFMLELQKSNYGNYYYLNLKGYVNGVFMKKHVKDKKLSHSSMEAFFRRPPGCYDLLFDLDILMTDEERQKGIIKMFDEFICHFAQNSLSISGIYDLVNNNELILTTSVKEELDRLIQ